MEISENAFAARVKADRARFLAKRSVEPATFANCAAELESKAAELERRGREIEAEIELS
jgi:hypothetical protein